MLHRSALTPDELAECPACVRDTIERVNARLHQTAATQLARRGLSPEKARTQAARSVERWAREHLGDKAGQELIVHLVGADVLRRGSPKGA
jgi:hypothetical protein